MNVINQILDSSYPLMHFKVGEPIFKEGDEIKGVFFIKKGKIKVTKDAKNSIIMWFANENEFVGISSFFDSSDTFSFNTYAFSDDVEVVFITSEEFRGLLKEYPEFKQEIIQILCDRITFARKRISNLKSQSIKQRFLDTILFLIDIKDISKSKVSIKYTVDELSELTGTSKQYIQKLIREFHQQKLIEQLKGNLMVVNLDKLQLSMS